MNLLINMIIFTLLLSFSAALTFFRLRRLILLIP